MDQLDKTLDYKPATNPPVPAFEIIPNYATQRVEIKINVLDFYVEFNDNNNTLGWVAGQTAGPAITIPTNPLTIYAGDNLADITNGLKSILLRIPNLPKNALLNGVQKSFLAAFSNNVGPGESFHYIPVNRQWFEVNNKDVFRQLHIQLVDQNGNIILMQGGNANPVHIMLQFQPVRLGIALKQLYLLYFSFNTSSDVSHTFILYCNIRIVYSHNVYESKGIQQG